LGSFVIPAKAGIQAASENGAKSVWTPAFAGVTVKDQEDRAVA
jgi:hypothetical protein